MPKSIDQEATDHIAKAASLAFSDEERTELTSSLGKMIELFIAMDKTEVCPTKQSDFNKTTYQCLRETTTACPATPKQDPKVYPHHDNETGFFVVPKVLNTEV